MKKSNFQKTFNICELVFFTGLLGFISSITLSMAMNALQSLPYLTFFYIFVSRIHFFVFSLAIISILLFLTLGYHEVYLRLKQDNLVNLWKSIKQTFAIRMFLKQSEHSETIATVEQMQITRYNPINKHFNKVAHKAIVDIREDKAILLIQIPRTQQATKILQDMGTLVSEEISNRNPGYNFSPPVRKGKWLLFIGTKSTNIEKI